MKQIIAGKMHTVIEYIRYIYKHSEGVFEDFGQPVAVYDREGKIIKATGLFRNLTAISEDDIRRGGANIYDCLNGENVGLLEAAGYSSDDGEKVLQNLVRPLRVKSRSAEKQAAKYIHAVFFSMTYMHGNAEYKAVYLMMTLPSG